MKNKKSFLICLGFLFLIGILIYLNQPVHLPALKSFPAVGENKVQRTGELTKNELPDKLSDVNPSLFKGKGDLAFIRDGFLYLIDNEGQLKRLTDSGKAVSPQWSFDGKYLAYLRITNPETNTGVIWITDKEGKKSYQVQGLPEAVEMGNFKWSPSYNLLAVKTSKDIWLVPLEGEPQKLTQEEGIFSFDWSPDGKYIAYSAPKEQGDILYTVDIKKGEKVSQLNLSGSGIGIEIAKWWPDGKGILFWRNLGHSASMRADGLELCSLEFGKKEPKSLGITLGYKEWLSFSPDGKKIAFVAADEVDDYHVYEEQEEWSQGRTLWISDSDGSNPKVLTEVGKGIYCPVWLKDGSQILYVKDNVIWVTDINAVKPQKIVGSLSDDKFGYYGHVKYLDNMFSCFTN